MTADPLLIQQMIGDALAPIRPLMEDKAVTEIMVTADGCVWVERKGTIANTGLVLSEVDRSIALTTVAKKVDRDMKANTPTAIVSTSIGGLRFAGALKPIDERGTTLCIRKHLDPAERPNLEQLVEWNMLSKQQADLLVDLIIVKKNNAVFLGQTGSGKTTLTNAILGKLPVYERVGVIEDAKELAISVPNCDCYLTNEQVGITSRLLIQHALRSRYDRLVIGETRGTDTFDVLRALESGHPGSITTIHGTSAAQGLGTLEMLYQMSLPPGASISVETTRGYIASAINLMVYAEKQYVPNGDGSFRSVRSVKEIASIKGVKDGKYEIVYL